MLEANFATTLEDNIFKVSFNSNTWNKNLIMGGHFNMAICKQNQAVIHKFWPVNISLVSFFQILK